MRKLTIIVLLLSIACSAQNSPVTLPYNDVHTEGYKGPIKTVVITSYFSPIFNSDSTTVQNKQCNTVMYHNFNQDGFSTSIRHYQVSANGKQLQYLDTFIYDNYNTYTVKKYDYVNAEHKTLYVKWTSDTAAIITEYKGEETQPQLIIQKALSRDYRLKESNYNYYTQDGSIRIKRKMEYIRNQNGDLLEIHGMSYNAPSYTIADKNILISRFIRKKHDRLNNITFFISLNNFGELHTIASEVIYTYYNE